MADTKILILIFTLAVLLIIIVVAVVLIKGAQDDENQMGVAEKKCKEYMEFACKKPVKMKKKISNTSSPIIGGEFAFQGQFPHMASLQINLNIVDKSGYALINNCGASLISDEFVMTAAHCINDKTRPEDISVQLGTTSLIGSTRKGIGEKFSVSKIYLHPNLNRKEVFNDIALLKLKNKVQFNEVTWPICLNIKLGDILENITAPGWGQHSTDLADTTPSTELMYVQLYINDETVKKDCIQQFGEERMKTNICAGHPTERKTEAHGDSGGPLQIPKTCPNTYEQIGIASFVNLQRKQYKLWPVVYTRVADYVPWIADIVWLKNQ